MLSNVEMSSILNMNRVNYECGCGEWWPLCNLYFCRHCSSLRCQSCSLSEIDSTFCPNCLENIPAGEARLKRNRCVNCNQCPICAMVVSTRAVGDSCHLMCSTCRWSTRDSDTPDQNTSVNWPIHEQSLDGELNLVMEKMRNLATAEKAQRDQIKMNKRRSTNIGSLLPDRYGLQTMYQKRKKTFEKPTPQAPVHEASAEVPELDINSLMNLVAHDIPSLDSRIRQPLAAGRTLRPVRMPLSARKAIRCKQCDHNLIKLEYGTCTIRYKIQYFARNFVPELRLSRETQLTAGEIGSVLLTIANESSAKTDVILMAENGIATVECMTQMVELSLPCPDETADLYDLESGKRDGSDAVMFRRRHKAGIRLEVNCPESRTSNILGLVIKYKNELSSIRHDTEPEWKVSRVRITLGAS